MLRRPHRILISLYTLTAQSQTLGPPTFPPNLLPFDKPKLTQVYTFGRDCTRNKPNLKTAI